MAKRKPKPCTLEVYKTFGFEGFGEEWEWRIAVPRQFTVRSVNNYTNAAGARRAALKVARRLGIKFRRARSCNGR